MAEAPAEGSPELPDEIYFVPHIKTILRGLGVDAIDRAQPRIAVQARFLAFLVTEFYRHFPFDAAWYARRYPDLAAAIAAGHVRDVRAHFLQNGLWEGRVPFAPPVDPAFYLAANPDLAATVARDGPGQLAWHYEVRGRLDGAAPHPLIAAAVRDWQEAIGDNSADLASATLDGALVQPFIAPVVPLFRGGLVLGDGPLEQRLRQRRDHRPADQFPPSDQPVHALQGAYVYGGPVYHHFGHVMSEMIHRILPARARFACRRLLFVAPAYIHEPPAGWEALPAAMRAALAFLEVAEDEVTVVRDNRVVERLHVVQQGSEIPSGSSPSYLNMLKSFTNTRLAGLPDGGATGRRFYVSRSRVGEGGLILGESYIDEMLAAAGYTVFHPEDYSLVDQLQTYRRAEVLMFAAGSAIHGTELFGPDDLAKCVLLPRGHAPNSYFETVLRPRARACVTLTGATHLGTAAVTPDGVAIPELGVSLLNLPAFAEEMSRHGLAEGLSVDAGAYRRRARNDFDRYSALYPTNPALSARIDCLLS